MKFGLKMEIMVCCLQGYLCRGLRPHEISARKSCVLSQTLANNCMCRDPRKLICRQCFWRGWTTTKPFTMDWQVAVTASKAPSDPDFAMEESDEICAISITFMMDSLRNVSRQLHEQVRTNL